MRSNHSVGRHRKPGPARALATRTAVSTGAAVAAVLMAGGPATAATAGSNAPTGSVPTVADAVPAAQPPCTGTPLDAIVGPVAGVDCNSNPADDDPTNPGGPGTPDDTGGGNPPAGQVSPALLAAAPAAEPPCTGTPLDAIVGPVAGVDCNSNPADNDPTNPGGGTPDDGGGEGGGGEGGGGEGGGTPPAGGGGSPGAPPISCTGSPLDAFTTCATGGHSQRGSDRGDAVGSDTPNYGSGGSGGSGEQGGDPPAA